MHFFRQQSYTPIINETLDENQSSTPFFSGKSLQSRLSKRNVLPQNLLWISICGNLLLGVTCTLLLLLPFHISGSPKCEHNSTPNPTRFSTSSILPDLLVPLISQQVNGSFYNIPSSIYRQTPSPEVDAAWSRIAAMEILFIPSTSVLDLGKDPFTAIRAPPHWNFGTDAYAATLDAFHQIHCLDSLRRGIYFEYYYTNLATGKVELPATYWTHVSHCLHVILQELMCAASEDLYTYRWTETVVDASGRVEALPQGDFSIERQCRDFEALLRYQEERGMVTDEMWTSMSVQPWERVMKLASAP